MRMIRDSRSWSRKLYSRRRLRPPLAPQVQVEDNKDINIKVATKEVVKEEAEEAKEVAE